jgi:hypothetical protein
MGVHGNVSLTANIVLPDSDNHPKLARVAGEKVHLTKEKEPLPTTRHGKTLESRLPGSLLKDRFAADAVKKIDYDCLEAQGGLASQAG